MGKISSRSIRLYILSLLDWVPDELMVRIQYFMKLGKWVKLKSPRDFNEWIQGYKLSYRNPLMKQLTDKYEVREYVKEQGLENILVPLIGVFEKDAGSQKILREKTSKVILKLEDLPKKFVAKTNDGAGGNRVFICKDKEKIDKHEFYSLITRWMNERKGKKHYAREWAYENDFSRKFLIEQYLEEEGKEGLDDYKFLCFGGKFKCLWVDTGRFSNHKRGFWDANLSRIEEAWCQYPKLDLDYKLPKNITEMITIAERLAKDFPFVRIDLYNLSGKIYFGELTFYPNSGYKTYHPASFSSLNLKISFPY